MSIGLFPYASFRTILTLMRHHDLLISNYIATSMPKLLAAYNIFIASPGGLAPLRQEFRDVVAKYNMQDAVRRGVVFNAIGWEDTLGGLGRPQALINQDLEECDYFLLVLHNRWGSDPGGKDGTSGSEEEYNLARRCRENGSRPMRELVVLFKDPGPGPLSDPGTQLQRVMAFRTQLEAEKKILHHVFSETTEFARRLEMHLAQWVREHEKRVAADLAIHAGMLEAAGKLHAKDVATNAVVPPTTTPVAMIGAPKPAGGADLTLEAAKQFSAEGNLTGAEIAFASLTSSSDNVEALCAFAEFLRETERYGQSEENSRKAITIASGSGDVVWIAAAEFELAMTFVAQGRLPEGLQHFSRSLDAHGQAGPSLTAVRATLEYADALRQSGDAATAASSFEAGLVMAYVLGDTGLIADALAGRGQLQFEQGQYDLARKDLEEAVARKRGTGQQAKDADLLVRLGNCLEKLGELQAARDSYEEALALFGERQDDSRTPDILDNLGRVLERLGDAVKAEATYLEAAQGFVLLQNLDGAVDAFLSVAKLREGGGNVDAALETYDTAFSYASQGRDRSAVTEIYASMERLVTKGAKRSG